MIRGTRPQQSGFTVIEVIVFMSVSIALVASALALFSTRIPRTQFSQAVTELDTKINTVANEVVNGFYPSTGNLTCNSSGISPNTPGSPSNEQGTNEQCVFLGRAIQFGPSEGGCSSGGGPNCDELRIYSVWGRRQLGGSNVTTIRDANPQLIDISDLIETYTTGFGLYIDEVIGAGSGVAYLSSFGSGVDVNGQLNGASQVMLVPIGGNLSADNNTFIANASGSMPTADSTRNPLNGVTICLRSGTSNQFATLTLAPGGKALTTDVRILSSPAEYSGAGC